MAETVETFAVSDEGFSLPVTDVLTGRGFVTGKSGSGKSNTASVVAEELLERDLPLLIVDTDGEYFGLTERYEILHVGEDDHCDLSMTDDDADRIAELALDENLPILLDVSGFLDEEAGRDLIYEVVKALFVAEKTRGKPFLLVVEEVHEFIPERGGSDDLSEMLVRVAKRGRKRGLGICGMSQRPAAVDKDFITQCDWLVWHRLTWENDTAVAERILGDDAAETVQSLDDGEALVLTDWDESIERVQFRRKRTLDAGATPDLGDARRSAAARSDLIAELSGGKSTASGDDSPSSSAPSSPTSSSSTRSTAPSASDDLPAVHDAERSDDDSPTNEGGSARERSRRRRSGDGTGDYDPVWEVGEMIVHLYGFVAASHRWLVEALGSVLVAQFERHRETLAGANRPYSRPESGRRDRLERVARRLSIVLVLAFYVGLFVSVLLLA